MKLFGTHLVFFVGGSGMKQSETFMREPFSKDSGMKLIDDFRSVFLWKILG